MSTMDNNNQPNKDGQDLYDQYRMIKAAREEARRKRREAIRAAETDQEDSVKRRLFE